jgi:hypothetical protein
MVEKPGPFSGSMFHTVNAWYEDSEGGRTRTYVYAGSLPGPGGEATQQGALILQVVRMSLKGNLTVAEVVDHGRFPTAVEARAVQIEDAVGQRLILSSTTGAQFYFDVPSREFVASLTVTVTPPAPTSPISPVPSASPPP